MLMHAFATPVNKSAEEEYLPCHFFRNTVKRKVLLGYGILAARGDIISSERPKECIVMCYLMTMMLNMQVQIGLG